MARPATPASWLIAAALILIGAARAPPAPQTTFISPSGEPFRPSQGGAPPFETWFARLDARHEGRIDRSAFEADATAFFHRLDANGDGVIDGFEISAYEKAIAPELTQQTDSGQSQRAYVALLNEPEPVSGADLSLDLRITAAEWKAATDRRFDVLDVRKTGFLDHDALVARLPKPDAPRKGKPDVEQGSPR